jgi:hypothetical protein
MAKRVLQHESGVWKLRGSNRKRAGVYAASSSATVTLLQRNYGQLNTISRYSNKWQNGWKNRPFTESYMKYDPWRK